MVPNRPIFRLRFLKVSTKSIQWINLQTKRVVFLRFFFLIYFNVHTSGNRFRSNQVFEIQWERMATNSTAIVFWVMSYRQFSIYVVMNFTWENECFLFSFKSLAIECAFRVTSCLRVNLILQNDIRDFLYFELGIESEKVMLFCSRSCNHCLLVEGD